MPNTLTLIEAKTLTNIVYTVDFQNIPQTYTDLKLLISGRSDAAAAFDGGPSIFFNNAPTGTNYGSTWIQTTGTSIASSRTSDIASYIGASPASTAVANSFSTIEIYIPSYTSSYKKAYTIEQGAESNTSLSYLRIGAGSWNQTSAISRISVYGGVGNWVANSTFYLYGIKNT